MSFGPSGMIVLCCSVESEGKCEDFVVLFKRVVYVSWRWRAVRATKLGFSDGDGGGGRDAAEAAFPSSRSSGHPPNPETV